VTRVIATRAEASDRLAGLRRIGIDEISYRKGQRYLLVVTDHDTGRLVWAGKDRTSATLRQFFDDLGPDRAAALTHVSADGAEFIHTVVTERAPQAMLCLDAFYADLRIMPTGPREPTVCPGQKGGRGLLSRHNPGCVSEPPSSDPALGGKRQRRLVTRRRDQPPRSTCTSTSPPNSWPYPNDPPNTKSRSYRGPHAPARLPGEPLIMPTSAPRPPPPPVPSDRTSA
jgi:hypothetical protein